MEEDTAEKWGQILNYDISMSGSSHVSHVGQSVLPGAFE